MGALLAVSSFLEMISLRGQACPKPKPLAQLSRQLGLSRAPRQSPPPVSGGPCPSPSGPGLHHGAESYPSFTHTPWTVPSILCPCRHISVGFSVVYKLQRPACWGFQPVHAAGCPCLHSKPSAQDHSRGDLCVHEDKDEDDGRAAGWQPSSTRREGSSPQGLMTQPLLWGCH